MLRICLIALVFSYAAPSFAQERSHDVKPEDYFTLNTITEIAVSPDAKSVAYGLATWDKTEDNRKGDVWVISTDGKGKPTKLTFDRANDRGIKWSGDGKHLYFVGNRKRAGETKPPYDGSTQVWRIDANGGDAKAITREDKGVSHYDYAPKADAIFFSKDKEHADQDEFAKLRAATKVEYGHGVRKVSEIYKIDMTSWRNEKLVDDTRYVREFAVTQDGMKIAMVSAFDDTVVKSEGESRVDVWEAGKVTTPPTDAYRKNPKNSPYAWLENLCWNPQGTRFAFTAVHDAFPAEVIIGLWKDGLWTVNNVDRKKEWEVVGYGRGLGTPMVWPTEESIALLCEKNGHTGMFVGNWNINTFQATINPPENFQSFSMTPGEPGLAYISSTNEEFSNLKFQSRKAKFSQNFNPHTSTWKLPTVQHITWKAPDGSEVGGVLELPPGYKKGDKLPLVVAIHGGPTTSTKADLNFDPHNGRLYFATAGYAVLLPNYRGSTGYGDKFVTDLIGRENDIEVKDNLDNQTKFICDLRDRFERPVLVYDYPGYGKSGGVPSEAGCYEAGEAAHRWLVETQQVPANRILLLGHSIGGGVTIELSRRVDSEAMFLISTFENLPKAAKARFFFLPCEWLMSNRFNSLAKLPSYRKPIFISHGDRDETIPYSQSERLFEAANEPKRLRKVEGGNHNGAAGSDVLNEARQFIEKERRD